MVVGVKLAGRDWVVASRTQWITAQDAPHGQGNSAQGPMGLQRLDCVLRARGLEPADRRHPAGEPLVAPDERH